MEVNKQECENQVGLLISQESNLTRLISILSDDDLDLNRLYCSFKIHAFKDVDIVEEGNKVEVEDEGSMVHNDSLHKVDIMDNEADTMAKE